MSGTIRSRTEAQRDRHPRTETRWSSGPWCGECLKSWPCPEWVAADDTLTDLNNAHLEDLGHLGRWRNVPDPDSRDWPMPVPPPYPADDEGE